MPFANMAITHYEPEGPGDAPKFCINKYPEETKTDSGRPLRLVRSPGTEDVDTLGVIQTSMRGLAQADGHAGGNILIVDGVTVRTYDKDSGVFATLTGAITGTDRAQWAFGEVEGAVLSGGQIFVSDGAAVSAAADADYAALLADHGQSGFSSIASLGQRLLFTYGSRWGFSSTTNFNETTAISYYTAENSPDSVVAGAVLGEMYFIFGTKTIEPWYQTGINDNPFQRLQGGVIQRGCRGRDTIFRMAGTLYFITDANEAARLSGNSYEKISPSWVDRLIRKTDAADLICSGYETEGHSFYHINGPDFCVAYDGRWAQLVGHEDAWTVRRTGDTGGWEWAHIVDVDGQQFVGSRLAARLAELSRAHLSDYGGAEIIREGSFHATVQGGRGAVPAIRYDGAKGIGGITGQGTVPKISLRLSRDNGQTWGAWRQRDIGKQGEYRRRTIWRQNGRTREPQLIGHYRVSDPIDWIDTGWAIGEDS